jgi:hypothetical protein
VSVELYHGSSLLVFTCAIVRWLHARCLDLKVLLLEIRMFSSPSLDQRNRFQMSIKESSSMKTRDVDR